MIDTYAVTSRDGDLKNTDLQTYLWSHQDLKTNHDYDMQETCWKDFLRQKIKAEGLNADSYRFLFSEWV